MSVSKAGQEFRKRSYESSRPHGHSCASALLPHTGKNTPPGELSSEPIQSTVLCSSNTVKQDKYCKAALSSFLEGHFILHIRPHTTPVTTFTRQSPLRSAATSLGTCGTLAAPRLKEEAGTQVKGRRDDSQRRHLYFGHKGSCKAPLFVWLSITNKVVSTGLG